MWRQPSVPNHGPMKRSQKLQRPRTNEERRLALLKPLRILEVTQPEHWLVDEEHAEALPIFSKRFSDYQGTLLRLKAARKNAVAERIKVRKRTRLFVLHFLESFCKEVKRETISVDEGAYFGFNAEETPSIGPSESDLELWGRRAIEGEKQRLAAGLKPVVGPDLAEVEEHMALFMAAQKASARATAKFNEVNDELQEFIPEVDEFLYDLWSTILFKLNRKPATQKRRSARFWGVVYKSTAIDESEEAEERELLAEDEPLRIVRPDQDETQPRNGTDDG